MARVVKLWVFNYKIKNPEYIGDYKGNITVSTHKSDLIDRALMKVKTRVVQEIKKLDIELLDKQEVEISLDVSYVV